MTSGAGALPAGCAGGSAPTRRRSWSYARPVPREPVTDRVRDRPRSEARILASARLLFARLGYDRATVRAIAAGAGVNPGLVVRYFGSKDALFTAVTASTVMLDVDHIVHGPAAGLAERFVRTFLTRHDGAGDGDPLLALLRSGLHDDTANARFQRDVLRPAMDVLAGHVGGDDAELRTYTAGSLAMGVVIARFVMRLEPVASADLETVIRQTTAAVAPLLDVPAGDG